MKRSFEKSNSKPIDLALGLPVVWCELVDSLVCHVPLLPDTNYLLDSTALDEAQYYLRQLHECGDQLPIEDNVILCAGASQALCSLIYSALKTHDTVLIVSQIPYYPFIQSAVSSFVSPRIQFAPARVIDGKLTVSVPLSNHTIINVIVSPTNPEGRMITYYDRLHTTLDSSSVVPIEYNVWDNSYAWPSYVSRDTICDHVSLMKQSSLTSKCIAIYSLSKCMGLAGQRVGYSVFLNSTEWNPLIQEYLFSTTLGSNRSGIAFSISVLKSVSPLTLWPRISQILSDRFTYISSLLVSEAHLTSCKGTAYAFVQFKDESVDAKECLLEKFGWLTIGGQEFGVSKNFARINLMYSLCLNIVSSEFVF